MPLNAFRVIQLLALILTAMFACPHPGFAAIRTVTDLGDTTPGGAPGQLRFEINAAAPGDTIVIPAGTITLTGAAGEDANASGDLDILKNLTIQGAGASLTIIDGGGIDRVIDVVGSTVIISGVTIAGGAVNCAASGSNSCFPSGAGLWNSGTVTLTNSTLSGNTVSCTNNAVGFCDGEGGGLENLGILTLTNVTLSGNAASCTNSGSSDCQVFGSGLSNRGTVTLTNSTLSGNTATCTNSADGFCVASSAGLFNSGTVTLTNSTLSGNAVSCTTTGSGSCGAYGAGLYNFGTVTLTNSTLSGNAVSCTSSAVGFCVGEGGGMRNLGILVLTNVTLSGNAASCTASGSGDCQVLGSGLSNSGTGTLHNTIVANSPAGGNCFGTMVSLGHNLDSGSTCGLTGPGDLSNTNPLLGPLADNGGPTATHALLPGSPAIDAGDNAGCPLLDQRGFVRPVDGDVNGSATCDIGAYELVPTIAAALAASVLPGGRSVQVGAPATAFATILNGGPETALGCRLAPVPFLPATFAYQTTNSVTNALTGTPNTPANIPAGGGQSFVFALTPTAPILPTDVQLSLACTNTAPAPTFVGVSTLFLVAAATPVPDPVALAATATHDGILTLASGAGAFAVATVNVGASALLTVTPDTGGASLPLTLSICQTDAGATCLAAPAPSVTTQIDAGATPTFSIFAFSTGPIPFLPGTNRIFVRFTDQGGVIRGATSVAVRTP